METVLAAVITGGILTIIALMVHSAKEKRDQVKKKLPVPTKKRSKEKVGGTGMVDYQYGESGSLTVPKADFQLPTLNSMDSVSRRPTRQKRFEKIILEQQKSLRNLEDKAEKALRAARLEHPNVSDRTIEKLAVEFMERSESDLDKIIEKLRDRVRRGGYRRRTNMDLSDMDIEL